MTGGGDLSNFVPVADPGAHHDGSGLYVSAQTPQLGDVGPVRIRVQSGTGVGSVFVRVVRDAEPMFVAAVPDGGSDYESWFTAEIPVHNPITSYRVLLDRESAGYSWLNGTGEYSRDIADLHDFRLTHTRPDPNGPWTP